LERGKEEEAQAKPDGNNARKGCSVKASSNKSETEKRNPKREDPWNKDNAKQEKTESTRRPERRNRDNSCGGTGRIGGGPLRLLQRRGKRTRNVSKTTQKSSRARMRNPRCGNGAYTGEGG